MRTRFMKPVFFGTLAVVASAIVAGPAFGLVFTPNTSQNQGSPPSQHAQQSTFIPGYTDFPNYLRLQDETRAPSIPGNGVFPDLQRLRGLLTPAERRQLDAVAATARSIHQQQGSTSFVPGYTDFPNVLRYHSTLTPTERRQLDAALAGTAEEQHNAALSKVHQAGVPGYSDFPNALRLHSQLTPTERRQLDAAVASFSGVSSSNGSDFSWGDAGLGAGIGFAIAGGLAILAIVGIRRDKATPAPA